MLKTIYIDPRDLGGNRHSPVITVKAGGNKLQGHRVNIRGPSTVIYSTEKSPSYGVSVWLETVSKVVILDIKMNTLMEFL